MSNFKEIEALYRREYKTYLKLAERKVGSFWAEDLVQETFLTAMKYFPTYNPKLSELNTWVSRIFDSCVKKFRDGAPTEEVTDDSWVTHENPENCLAFTVEDFLKDIEGRKENHKQVLYCYFVHEMKPKEIMQIIPESLHNINYIVKEFRREMRDRYEGVV